MIPPEKESLLKHCGVIRTLGRCDMFLPVPRDAWQSACPRGSHPTELEVRRQQVGLDVGKVVR